MDGKRTNNIITHRSAISVLLLALFIAAALVMPAVSAFAKEYYLAPRLVHSSHVLRLGDFITAAGAEERDKLLDPFPLSIQTPAVVSASAVRTAIEKTGRRDFILVGTHCLVVPEEGEEAYVHLLTFLQQKFDTEGGWIEVSVEADQLEKITGETVFLSAEKTRSYGGYTSRFDHPTHTIGFSTGVIELTVRKFVPGIEAVRKVGAGEIIEKEDVRQDYVRWTDEDNPPAAYDILESGYVAKSAIPAGNPVFLKDIKKETLMESGARISIHIQRGSITMRLEGIVYGSGGLGDRVRVKPVHADRSLYGKIVSPREVVVEGL